MYIEINMTDTEQDLGRFSSPQEMRQFLKDRDIDGLELIPCMQQSLPETLEPEDVIGVHLRFYPSWIDFWNNNRQALLKEFGTEEIYTQYFCGNTRETFLDSFRRELDMAQAIGARYVVFHVSECVISECMTYHFLHSDLEVVEAAAEVINCLLDGKDYSFWFLMENLWWSGLTLTDNQVTRTLLERVHYPKKGLMLDTGHLLHTNLNIRTQEEGVRYIHRVLDSMGNLASYIHGIHLNQSLSGDYVRKAIAHPATLTGTYWEKLPGLYDHVGRIDYHAPFTAAGVADLIRRIAPDFVTYELITTGRQQLEEKLNAQVRAIREQGGIR